MTRAQEIERAARHLSEVADQIWVRMSNSEGAALCEAYRKLDAALALPDGGEELAARVVRVEAAHEETAEKLHAYMQLHSEATARAERAEGENKRLREELGAIARQHLISEVSGDPELGDVEFAYEECVR